MMCKMSISVASSGLSFSCEEVAPVINEE
jgi:hypothetical protein